LIAQHILAEGPLLPAPPLPRRWRRAVCATTLLALALLVFAHRPLFVGFARHFRVDDPAPSDAIVVLTGGWLTRPLRAAELYRQGMAPLILLSASEPFPYPDLCESALNRKVLIHAGVPDDDILVLPRISTSTVHEATQVRDYIRTHPMRRIIVVTTAFHTSRSRWIFQRILRGTGVEVRAAAAEDPRFDESNWYTNQGFLAYLQEALKRLVYQLSY
jgi:uncharacterized SAM-binding protein YcdF (DUF218 family)